MSVVGVMSALVVIVGCSSSSNGKPEKAPDSGAAPSGSASLPAAISSSLPVVAGGGSKFCQDFVRNGSFAQLGSSNGAAQLAPVWRRLADEAPSEIKPDMGVIADYLGKVADGTVTSSDLQTLSPAAASVGTYVGLNCH